VTRMEERCNWWTEIDDDILGCLAVGGALAPAEIGLRLGISEKATASLLSMLVGEGKVRICLVELPEADGGLRVDESVGASYPSNRRYIPRTRDGRPPSMPRVPSSAKNSRTSKMGAAFAPDSDEQAEHPTRPTS
jgi:hypothetical protein